MKHQLVMNVKETREIIARHFGVEEEAVIFDIMDDIFVSCKVDLGPFHLNGENIGLEDK